MLAIAPDMLMYVYLNGLLCYQLTAHQRVYAPIYAAKIDEILTFKT